MIFLLDSGGGGGGKQLATDFIICPILCCLILVFEYQVLLVGLGIVVRYNGPDFFRASGRCSSHSSNNFPGSVSRLPPSTTSAEESDGLDFSALLVSFSSDFL